MLHALYVLYVINVLDALYVPYIYNVQYVQCMQHVGSQSRIMIDRLLLMIDNKQLDAPHIHYCSVAFLA